VVFDADKQSAEGLVMLAGNRKHAKTLTRNRAQCAVYGINTTL